MLLSNTLSLESLKLLLFLRLPGNAAGMVVPPHWADGKTDGARYHITLNLGETTIVLPLPQARIIFLIPHLGQVNIIFLHLLHWS